MNQLCFQLAHRSIVAVLIVTVSFFSAPPQAEARSTPSQKPKPTPSQKTTARSIRFVPPTPPDPGEPDDRGQGGGSRGPACKPYESVAALIPQSEWGLTTRDRPTLWIHAPQGIAAGVAIEWVLRDSTDNPLYKTTFKAPKTPAGVISLSVPSTAPALKIGQPYRWTASIFCDLEEPDQPVTIRGRIQRTALSASLQRQIILAKSPLERAVLYANNGIWYDAITTLGIQLRTAFDPPTATAWAELLQQGDLPQSASAAIVPCCTFKPQNP